MFGGVSASVVEWLLLLLVPQPLSMPRIRAFLLLLLFLLALLLEPARQMIRRSLRARYMAR
jgi:hypothetical protein